jgi:anthranilate phosphoribosyltransferase
MESAARSPDLSFRKLVQAVCEGRDLSGEESRWAFCRIIDNAVTEAESAALLIGLRMKGESAAELAGAAAELRARMIPFETGSAAVLDTCGTGGDATGTFNISTATALVAAAAGVRVVKHGNRATSSRSGSIDVLAALGVVVHDDLCWTRRCLDEAGIAICFAPHFHPALRNVAALRQRLGIRTIFNCLGPLANPAGASYQLLGVGDSRLLDSMAGAAAALGINRAVLVCGADGMDEVSLAGATFVREVRGNSIRSFEWTPANFGLEPCSCAEIQVHSPEESAALIRRILDGEDIAATRVVIANAAAALLAAERVPDLPTGVALATTALEQGRAKQVLQRLVLASKE